MARILVLFAHPRYEKSRVQSRLVAAIRKIPGVNFRDLYEEYPDFEIDVDEEKALLVSNDIVVFQHPLYWYSAPPLMKQWLDLVLEYGWAYGQGGFALRNKHVLQVVSAGSRKESYSPDGRHQHTVKDFLAPFEQSFRLCHMNYLSPFIVYGTHRLGLPEVDAIAEKYSKLLSNLQTGQWLPDQLTGREYALESAGIIPTNTQYHG